MIWTACGFLVTLLLSEASGLQSLAGTPWLHCQLVEEQPQVNSEGHSDMQYRHRPAVLQFGHAGDQAIHPNAITFLVTGSKVDIRKFAEGGEDTLQCEVRRHSTGGIYARWPSLGAQEHDDWFTCTLRHTQGLFVITTFLRHTPATPSHAEKDDHKWTPIRDSDMLTTSAAMVVLTRTPTVTVGLLQDPKLRCLFAVDHKQPNVTVEWRHQSRGDRTKLFSFSSRTGKSLAGANAAPISTKALLAGDATLTLRPVRLASEGTYTCSVYVPPLYGSHDITLSIMEPPRVSVSVGSALTLQEGEDHKVVCEALSYYPLDVHIEWLREPSGGGHLPEVLKNVLFSSHRRHQDGTYSISAFFLLRAELSGSGERYTCRVSHTSLITPVRKTFTLTVTEVVSALWYLLGLFTLVTVVILVLMLHQLHSAGKERNKRKPY